ncbi:hypothetical protein BSZ22_32180 [Bradyrhizobium canariense]|uniref:Uncharacterized protein n=2 Tax=Nitrobacteraceae TaxID=41294 RepID=A0A1X3FD27_9BRAD|nr:hypothetical protein BSZ22_32180 [Bradyrhizobium canariense]OSI79176.1 hypothetical protein BSZ23_15585 [Bradyrhizobium canariense]OSI90720.1 hypothetical protein BSZ24_19605 [Bradyrhizobium canariense]OSI91620.1 hypothetical protein BSZ25_14485 [Bradyrhizobium canariense]OSJ03686.1 hypothetical protein BSZ18_30710 [Bradyrhizobium canariense]
MTAYQPRLKRAETGKLLIRASVMNTSMTTIRHESSNDFRVIQSGTIAIALNRAMAAAGVIPWTTIRARRQEREQRQTNVSAKQDINVYPWLPHPELVCDEDGLASLRTLAAARFDYACINLSTGTRQIASMGLSGRIEPPLSSYVVDEGYYVCFSEERLSPAFVDAFSNVLRQSN